MTALMDKAREITGLTEKISIAQLTSLMSSLSVKNLITEPSKGWVKVTSAWNKTFDGINPVSQGDTYIFSTEVKDNQYEMELAVILFDSNRNMLNPYADLNDGNAPVYKGNESNVYIADGFSNVIGRRSIKVNIKPNNCKYISFKVVSKNLGDFEYRNPIAFKQVGGVTKRLLSSLVPRIGGACYVV